MAGCLQIKSLILLAYTDSYAVHDYAFAILTPVSENVTTYGWIMAGHHAENLAG